jgi:hypothetical protein
MAHFRYLKHLDRLLLLEMLILPEYSEQLRLANVQEFDQALPIMLAYEKTLKNSSALSRPVNQHVIQPVNASTTSINAYQPSNDAADLAKRNRDEISSLREKLSSFENLIQDLSKYVKKKNNYQGSRHSQKWCNFHKTSSHSDSECKRQKNNSNSSTGSRYQGSNGRSRYNGSSGDGRNESSSNNNTKN